MTEETVIFLARRTLVTTLIVVGPLLGAGLIVGLAVAVLQAVTSIREMTLTMIPKILAVVGVLFWLLPWMLKIVMGYTTEMFQWTYAIGT